MNLTPAIFTALIKYGFHGESYANSVRFEPTIELQYKEYEIWFRAEFSQELYGSEIKPQTFDYECFKQVGEDYQPCYLTDEQKAILIGFLESENDRKVDEYLEENPPLHDDDYCYFGSGSLSYERMKFYKETFH